MELIQGTSNNAMNGKVSGAKGKQFLFNIEIERDLVECNKGCVEERKGPLKGRGKHITSYH